MNRMVSAGFCFPRGGADRRVVAGCMEELEKWYGDLSPERIVDFCVAQVYAVYNFPPEYLKRWKASHSFGSRSLERYRNTGSGKRYYEDVWMKEQGITRSGFLQELTPHRKHPLSAFIDPAYEEHTKRRLLSTSAGYYICGVSTLMWNPFSFSCGKCGWKKRCMDRTRVRFPELYRLRIEKSGKGSPDE